MVLMRLAKQLKSSGVASSPGLSRQAELLHLHTQTHLHMSIHSVLVGYHYEKQHQMVTVPDILLPFHQVGVPDLERDDMALYCSVLLSVSKWLPSFACLHLGPTYIHK